MPGRTLRALVVACLAAALAAPSAAAESRPEIRDLHLRRDEQQIRLSYQLVGAFDEEVKSRIESGLPTGFVFEARLERQRRWWFNDTVERSRLEVVAMYNAVTREYLVNTKQDGRLIDSRVVMSLAEAEKTMTRVQDLGTFHLDPAPRGRLRVLVRAVLGSRTVLSLFPTSVHTAWAETEPFRLASGSDEEP